MTNRWKPGDLIVRSEELGLQPAEVAARTETVGVWLETPVFVVEDTADQLVSYTATGAQFGFPDGPWLHPWLGRTAWSGHGCLMVQRPQDHFAIWHFWEGSDRTFVCWYLNLQTAFVRTPTGYHTQDLELDIIVYPDGGHVVKDDELLEERVAQGRYSSELVNWIRKYGARLTDRLDAEGPWWDRSWASWTPPTHWIDPELPSVGGTPTIHT
jgi:hypothetical protein